MSGDVSFIQSCPLCPVSPPGLPTLPGQPAITKGSPSSGNVLHPAPPACRMVSGAGWGLKELSISSSVTTGLFGVPVGRHALCLISAFLFFVTKPPLSFVSPLCCFQQSS